MSTSTIFSLPLAPYQQPAGLKSTHGSRWKRKRKGSHISQQQQSDGVQIRNGHAGSLRSPSPSPQSSYSAVLTPDEIYQYAVAGQAVEVELQNSPFPHADSANREGPSRFCYRLRQQIRPTRASLSEKDSLSTVGSLHQQHLAVLTAILHRSVLDEDFMRAGRALGMILRDDVGGRAVDVRAGGRWGIGAEILMRQDAQRQHRGGEQSRHPVSEPNRVVKRPRAWFTRKGFEDAKKYYERLIVQYPFFKQNPSAVSPLDFYPAMFGLWIYVVHHEARLNSLDSKSAGNDSAVEDHPQDTSARPVVENLSEQEVTFQELSQAREIADRMDSVMNGLPYKEDVNLIDLRRMLQLRICDLEEGLERPADEGEQETSYGR